MPMRFGRNPPTNANGDDDQHILGKDKDKHWPMSIIGVTKSVDVSTNRNFI